MKGVGIERNESVMRSGRFIAIIGTFKAEFIGV